MTFTPTSASPQGSHLKDAWQGALSWHNGLKLPDNTAIQANSAEAVAYLVQNVRGTIPAGYAAYPYINTANFNAEVHLLSAADAAPIPYTPFFMIGTRSTQTWAQKAKAMAEHGFRIPPGVLPTKLANGTVDSDGTLAVYEYEYKWPGNPANTAYWGRGTFIWGAIDPDSNEAKGLARRWTCKYAGRFVGMNLFKPARGLTRISGADVANRTNPEFVAPATATSGTTVDYPGFGREGVGMESNGMVTASMLPITHNQITMRDLLATDPETGDRGYIDHPVMFMLYPRASSVAAGTLVWPAVGYDGASTALVPHGSRFRLPANFVVNPAWEWRKKMIVRMMMRFGIFLGDTTGATGLSFRAEAGSTSLWEFGTGGVSAPNPLMLSLPWESLVKIAVGNDTTFNITSTTPATDTTSPVISARSPALGGVNIDRASTVSVTFSEAVQGVSGSTFALSSAGGAVAASVSGAGATWTLIPSAPLDFGTLYTVTLTGGAAAIRDLSDNPLATTSWTFTSVADTPAPPPTITPGRGRALGV